MLGGIKVNQRNVDALAVMIEDAGLRDLEEDDCRRLAEWLASHGTLAPLAVTDLQAWDIIFDLDGITHTSHEAGREVRRRLEHIAKGEI